MTSLGPAEWENDYWTPEPWWKGETFFVLASGPSLTREVCEKIRGQNAIVINASFRQAPWAPVWFFIDSSIYERYREFVKVWPGEVITMSRTAKRELNKRVKRVKGSGDPTSAATVRFPPVGSEAIRHGRNSGQTAIGLGIALGGTRCGLLGFDCRVVDVREHHHDDYVGTNRDLDVYAREFAPGYAGWRAAALAAGVEIFNCTPGSAIKEFPFASVDRMLEMSKAA